MAVDRSFILASFSKEKAEQVVDEFETLSFWKKPKNILGLFYIAISVISLVIWIPTWVIMRSEAMDVYPNALSLIALELLLGVFIYVFLAIFVFRNHRWAMILACLLYLADKALVVVFDGFSLRPFLIGFVCILLTWRAILVVNAMKTRKMANISTFD